MTITAASPWRSAPRISRASFATQLNQIPSPAIYERDPGLYWDYIVVRGVDPLYILEQFRHESDCGTKGIATQTRSWGNTRAPNFGIGYEPRTVPGRSGVFPVFLTWMDGLVTTVERLLAPTWYYANRQSIGEIFIQPPGVPVWAPAGDLNDPAGYLRSVLDGMNAHADQQTGGGPVATATWLDGSVVPIPTAADLGYPVTVQWLQSYGEARAAADLSWFVEHDTEGSTVSGAVSAMNGAGSSAHLVVARDGAALYCVPITVTAYAAGNLPVNNQSVNVENVGFVDGRTGGYTEAQYRVSARFFAWCRQQGMVNVPAVYIGRQDADGGPEPDAPGILGHMDVPRDDGARGWGGNYGHTDPGPSFRFDHLIALIRGGADAPADTRTFPETGQSISGRFKGAWERFEDDATSIELFGYPVREPREENGVTVQWFQRARMEDRGGRIVYGLLGAEALRARGEHGPGIDP